MVYMVHLAIENAGTFSVVLVDGPVAFIRGGAIPTALVCFSSIVNSGSFGNCHFMSFSLDISLAQAYSSVYESVISRTANPGCFGAGRGKQHPRHSPHDGRGEEHRH
jgi:hypothetical protein